MTDAFEWHQSEDVAVRTQMAIAVYLNPFGELVIRQEGQFHPDEDVWVVIAPKNVPAVIEAMQQAMGLPAGAAIKDPTAANRQRRHRDKLRDNRNGEMSVTGSPPVTDRDRLPLLRAAE